MSMSVFRIIYENFEEAYVDEQPYEEIEEQMEEPYESSNEEYEEDIILYFKWLASQWRCCSGSHDFFIKAWREIRKSLEIEDSNLPDSIEK